MLNLSVRTEYKGEIKTLKLTKDPFRHGLGSYTDENWDVQCIVGKSYSKTGRAYVNARKESDSPGYYSTATYANRNGSHTWIPYYFEVVN